MMMETKRILTVNEVNIHIKNLLSGDFLLRSICIRGEISNFKHHSSGHMYFSLKDDVSTLKCVMFRSYAQRLNFRPAHGMEVIAVGYISVYERDGTYQFYVSEMITAGSGALNIAYEQLKERLSKEGLFDSSRKRALPYWPRKIGIVTSPTGAAIQDMISVIKRRNPKVPILIIPAQVQGAEGSTSLTKALEAMYQTDVDVIITGRGGGSLEELWCFNEEKVVRKIAASPVPIISAVGHETDVTLADFAADVRAVTPSMAAELAVPVLSQAVETLTQYQKRLYNRLNQLLQQKRLKLEILANHPLLNRSEQFLQNYRQYVDQLEEKLCRQENLLLESCKQEVALLAGKLDALSPLKVLNRGFAVCENLDGRLIRQNDEVAVNEEIHVILSRGRLKCIVKDNGVENNG